MYVKPTIAAIRKNKTNATVCQGDTSNDERLCFLADRGRDSRHQRLRVSLGAVDRQFTVWGHMSCKNESLADVLNLRALRVTSWSEDRQIRLGHLRDQITSGQVLRGRVTAQTFDIELHAAGIRTRRPSFWTHSNPSVKSSVRNVLSNIIVIDHMIDDTYAALLNRMHTSTVSPSLGKRKLGSLNISRLTT